MSLFAHSCTTLRSVPTEVRGTAFVLGIIVGALIGFLLEGLVKALFEDDLVALLRRPLRVFKRVQRVWQKIVVDDRKKTYSAYKSPPYEYVFETVANDGEPSPSPDEVRRREGYLAFLTEIGAERVCVDHVVPDPDTFDRAKELPGLLCYLVIEPDDQERRSTELNAEKLIEAVYVQNCFWAFEWSKVTIESSGIASSTSTVSRNGCGSPSDPARRSRSNHSGHVELETAGA